MALKLIKNKIKSTERTSKVTKAMEAVSAVKMRKSQERALKGRSFAEASLRILENISHSLDVQNHSFLKEDFGSHDCLVVITADKGLAGSLNSAVIKEATNYLKTREKGAVELVCFGKKAYEFFLRREYAIPHHYVNVSDDVNIVDMEEVVTFLTTQFKTGKYKNVHVVYQNFKSTFEQQAIVRQVLPIRPTEVSTMIADILPRHGKYSEESKPVRKNSVYTIEQNYETLFDSIFSSLVEIMLYHALLESKASEHSARMVAMKNATDKAKDVTKILTLQFNKARQSVITAEVSEITGGIEAMKNA
jgi:F-type H+-transporting ATPase subunit gamma